MPRLSQIDVEAPVADASDGDLALAQDLGARALRPVAALYADALVNHELHGPRAAVQVAVAPPRLGRERLSVVVAVDPPRDRPEWMFVGIPARVAALTTEHRTVVMLEALHAGMCALARPRGWDPAALAQCRQHVQEHGPEYGWDGPWKTSPDRRLRARGRFRLLPDGVGRIRLEVVERDGGPVTVSDEAVALHTPGQLVGAARSLRWQGSGAVAMALSHRASTSHTGLVHLEHEEGAWRSTTTDHEVPPALPTGDPDAQLPVVEVVEEGLRKVRRGPGIWYLPETARTRTTARYHDHWQPLVDRFKAADGQRWWGGSGIPELRVTVEHERRQAAVRARTSDEGHLIVTVHRPGRSVRRVGDEALQTLALQDVQALVEAVRRRTGLGPHPGFPDA